VIRSLTGSFAPLPLARSPRASSSSPPPGDPDLFDYDSRFESTHRPCDLLWGPGDPAMPCSGSPVTIPRQTRSRPSTACSRSNTTATGSPSCAAQAPRRRLGPATGRHWYLIRADTPSHAFNHQRRLLAGEPGKLAREIARYALQRYSATAACPICCGSPHALEQT